jgi:putative heme-binding domain-containing protein
VKVVESYRDALKMSGDEGRGKQVFDNNCARCHMPRPQGGRVGPDLSGVNNKTKEELLTSILNPSYAIEPHYVHYVVTTALVQTRGWRAMMKRCNGSSRSKICSKDGTSTDRSSFCA